MARPGPAPKPTALKILAGNPGGKQLNSREPKPEIRAPRMPKGLPDEAQKFWKRNVSRLVTLGVLTEIDGPAFAIMSIHYAIVIEAIKQLDGEDVTIEDDNKDKRKNPAMQILRDNSTAFRMYASEFGMTPASRSKINIAKPEEVDPFEEWARGKLEE